MMVSLRRTALLWMTGLLTAAGLAAIFGAYNYARSQAEEFLDGQLQEIALNAGAGVSPLKAPAEVDQDPENRHAITIWDGSGHVIHQSLPDVQIPRQEKPGFTNLAVRGEMWRVYTVHGHTRTIQVAQRDTVRAEIASSAALGIAAPLLIVIPLSWLVVGGVMNHMLRRLNDLSKEIAARSVTAEEPISLVGVPSEVTPLVDSMNGLITRLRAALEAQKRFLADAAHELRTPLAAMQIQVDNIAASGGGSPNEGVKALAAGVKRAGVLVDQLLKLARLDEAAPARSEEFDLTELLLDCVGDFVTLVHDKDVDIGLEFAGKAKSWGVEAEVRTLFANLIGNAARYTPSGGSIEILLGRRDGCSVVDIIDTGPGLPKGAETRIFDRFYRAASSDTEGSGLGLAIVRRIAERHGFELTVKNRIDGQTGVIARVVIPSSAGGPDADPG
jgi:two-component system OmpR family sensor kinase